MATPAKPKSILKKIPYPATTSSKETRDREVALYHANILQQRKDIELEILLSTETLIDYPLEGAPYSAANPSLSDATTFKNLLRPFQPSDYDALIIERNIDGHCGYTLCPNKNQKESGGGRFRLLGMNGKAKDFRVVEKEELEKWCSDACARRALYVKVQLSESPAWERGSAEYRLKIDLLDEPKSDECAVVDGMESMRLDGKEDRGKKQDTADLALERGDGGHSMKNGLVDVTIKEKRVQKLAEAPSLGTTELSGRMDRMHLTMEGYTPSFGTEAPDIDINMDYDDEEDTDFKL